jgi:calcium-dependent protein kinase
MGCGGSKEIITKLEINHSNNDIIINSSLFVRRNQEEFKNIYLLGDLIGKGSFGKVYKVMHNQTKHLRAMKMVFKKNIEESNIIEREISLLSQLDHPNIIKVFEYFDTNSSFHIIQEFASGGELFDKINEIQSFNEANAAYIIEQLLSAVCYIHSKNVVHRDLKPENILLETRSKDDYYIKLIDFGTACLFNKKDKLSLRIGTSYYMAPEVIKKSYTEKCDIWSCGVILYILLVGYPPFDGGKSDDDDSILNSITRGRYSLTGKDWDKISNDAKSLIKRMLTYDYYKRPTAEDCLRDSWIQKFKKPNNTDITRLNIIDTHKLYSKHKLREASIAYIVHQISTNETIKNLRAIFKKMDESGDGKLSFDELKNGWKKYFKDTISEIEFEHLIKDMDQDKNNFVEYEEFLRVTINSEILLTENNLNLAFNFFDKDKSGKLSLEEVKNVLGIVSDDPKNKEIVSKIIRDVDTNGDGEVSFDEFKVLMKNTLSSKLE